MNAPDLTTDPPQAQAIADLYEKAARELLQAYQHNKAATRHHARGAFRAALHHARMSSVHSSAAHEHLAHALQGSVQLSSIGSASVVSVPVHGTRRDH